MINNLEIEFVLCWWKMKISRSTSLPDPVPVLQELAQFVGVEATREFCQDVAKACEFDRLKQADEAREMPQHIAGLFHNNSPSFYRKGVAGDWKNTFTVAQSEMFDQFMATQQEKGIPYGFRWQ